MASILQKTSLILIVLLFEYSLYSEAQVHDAITTGSTSCKEMQAAELERYLAREKELNQEIIDLKREFSAQKQKCSDPKCVEAARKNYEEKLKQIRIELNNAKGEHEKKLTDILFQCKDLIQTGDSCKDAQAAEYHRLDGVLKELSKEKTDTETEYRNQILMCEGGNPDCVATAGKEYRQKLGEIKEKEDNEKAVHKKKMDEILTQCEQQLASKKDEPTPLIDEPKPSLKEPLKGHIYYNCDPNEGVGQNVSPDMYQQLMQLAKEMDRISTGIADQGVLASDEFFQGLVEWVSETATFLAQQPGVPAQQIVQTITDYLLNSNEENHRILYKAAENALHEAKKNPARFCGKNLPNVLPTAAAAAKLRMTKRLIDGSEVAKDVFKTSSDFSGAKCYGGAEDCFWKSMASATGDNSYLLRTKAALKEEVYDHLKKRFGGSSAKDPLTPPERRASDLKSMVEGVPIPVTPDEFVDILNSAPDNYKALVFVDNGPGTTGHVFEVAKFKGRIFFWDTQGKTSNLDIITAGYSQISIFRYQ